MRLLVRTGARSTGSGWACRGPVLPQAAARPWVHSCGGPRRDRRADRLPPPGQDRDGRADSVEGEEADQRRPGVVRVQVGLAEGQVDGDTAEAADGPGEGDD